MVVEREWHSSGTSASDGWRAKSRYSANDPIADVRCLVHSIMMTKKLWRARAAQFGVLALGAVMLISIYFGLPIVFTVTALLAAASLVPAILGGMKCHRCGVSYFFDQSMSSWNISGVNLLKPCKPDCPKCGAGR